MRTILGKHRQPGCITCKLHAGDTPTLTIDSIVICQTHAGDLRTFVHGMHPGHRVEQMTKI
jgi:hypothetical protein